MDHALTSTSRFSGLGFREVGILSGVWDLGVKVYGMGPGVYTSGVGVGGSGVECDDTCRWCGHTKTSFTFLTLLCGITPPLPSMPQISSSCANKKERPPCIQEKRPLFREKPPFIGHETRQRPRVTRGRERHWPCGALACTRASLWTRSSSVTIQGYFTHKKMPTPLEAP